MDDALRALCVKGIYVVTPQGEVIGRGRAGLFLVEHCLGWRWTARALRVPPFVWLVELGYTVVANNRRFFARFLFRSETRGPLAPGDPPPH